MKYTRLTSHNTPSSLQDWLEEQLENHGIDGVIYTRYILSVLQDDDDEEEEEEENFDESESKMEEMGEDTEEAGVNDNRNDLLIENVQSLNPSVSSNGQSISNKRHLPQKAKNNCKKLSNKSLHKRYQQRNISSCRNVQQSKKWLDNSYQDCTRLMNIEQKRSIVVECLKSASEEDFEIESLVDELCAKLREYKYSKMGHSQGTTSNKKDISIATNSNNTSNMITTNANDKHLLDNESKIISSSNNNSLKEQARRYYAAFPALSTNALTTPVTNLTNNSELAIVSSDNEKTNNLRHLQNVVLTTQDENIYKENEIKEIKWDSNVIEYNMNQEEIVNDFKSYNFGASQAKTYINDIENIINNNNYEDDQLKQSHINEMQSQYISEKVQEAEDLFTNIGKKGQLHYGGVNSFSKTDEDEKYKSLAAKFDSNIASLWNDQNIGYYNKDSIWCFGKENVSSPIYDNPINLNLDENPFSSANLVSSSIWNSLSNDTDVITDSSISQKVNHPSFSWDSIIKSKNQIDFDFNKTISKPFSEISSIEKLRIEENTTTLSNHGEDSLFVEVVPSSGNVKKYSLQNFYANNSFQKQNLQEYGLLTTFNSGDRNDEKETESLLTSAKTHFQPIKQESLDDEFDSIDGEVSSLVPCSGKCPNLNVCSNNNNNTSYVNSEIKNRSLSTSLSELSSIMGPFIEDEVDNESDQLDYIVTTIEKSSICFEQSEKIEQTSNNEENEFDELCSMLNSATVWNLFDEDKDNLDPPKNKDDIGCVSWSYCKEPLLKNKIENLENEYVIQAPNEDHIYYKILDNNVDLAENAFLNADLLEASKLYSEMQENENFVYEKTISDFFPSNIKDSSCMVANSEFKNNVEWSTGEIYEEYNNKELASGESSDPSQIFFSWNLEKEWQEENVESTSTSVLKKELDARRPCSFFLEGNCRRSDCKFSHDLSNITCKFWLEGSCFKGALCPFLHGYPSYIFNGNPEDDENNSKEFTIESEADFPALTTGDTLEVDNDSGDCFSNVVIGKNKFKPEKQESNVLFRIVKKKQKKGSQRASNEKAV